MAHDFVTNELALSVTVIAPQGITRSAVITLNATDTAPKGITRPAVITFPSRSLMCAATNLKTIATWKTNVTRQLITAHGMISSVNIYKLAPRYKYLSRDGDSVGKQCYQS
jgi:hypothetical protein